MNSGGATGGRDRRRTRLRSLLALIFSLALSSCGWTETIGTHLYRVTIRVDGVDYTSEVVRQRYRNVTWGNFTDSPHGSVLTFRLPDDRVIVLGTTRWIGRLECVPRLDGTVASRCNGRWPMPNQDRHPDGYIFNSATHPTAVEAFQFEPRSHWLAAGRAYAIRSDTRIATSRLAIELVAYDVKSVVGAKPRDSLERDFPGYEHVYAKDITRNNRPVSYELTSAASDLAIGLKKFR